MGLYYGDKAWEGNTELYDLFNTDKPFDKEFLKNYIPNYKINLLAVANVTDLALFKSDLHMIFGMIKYRKNKDELIKYTNDNITKEEVAEFINL